MNRETVLSVLLFVRQFQVNDVKYSRHQQPLIQNMDFYLSPMKTDVKTKLLLRGAGGLRALRDNMFSR